MGLGLLTLSLTLYFATTFGSDQLIFSMAAGMYQINTTQLPRFTFEGDNQLDFLQGFPDVADNFGFLQLIDRDRCLARLEEDWCWVGSRQAENLTLSKLKF